ncbi:MAG: hypothetical protein MJA30_05320 [Cytophagales bacterium]|nr:hypothetical protein [Cytophagales bacterium]
MNNKNDRKSLVLGTRSARSTKVLCGITLALVVFFTACNTEEEGITSPISTDAILSVEEAAPGDLVAVSSSQGFGNDPEQVSVYFSGEEAEIINFSSAELVVEVPENATTGQVSLEANGKTSIIKDIFKIIINRIRPTYWVESNAGVRSIVKGVADLQGNTSKSVIYTTSRFISALTLEPISNQVYWVEQDFDRTTFRTISTLFTGDADGIDPSSITTVLAGRENVTTVTVSLLRNKLYWGELSDTVSTGFIFQADLSGNNISALYATEEIENPTSLKFDAIANKLYFVDDASEVQLALGNGSGLSVIYDNSNFRDVGGLAIDRESGDLFVSDLGFPGDESDVILAGRLDGSTAPLDTLIAAIPGAGNPVVNTVALDVDRIGNFVYWLNSGAPGGTDGTIYRIKTDGSGGPQLIFDGITNSSSIDVRGRKKESLGTTTFSLQ